MVALKVEEQKAFTEGLFIGEIFDKFLVREAEIVTWNRFSIDGKIRQGYFSEEGLDLTLITGFGADKVLTALISGEADIGFMGAEASIYAYQEGATDPVVNFAQLTQRAGNFLVAREEMPDFKWEDLKGKKVLGGRKGGVHTSM